MILKGQLIGFTIFKSKKTGTDMFCGTVAFDPSARDVEFGQHGRKICTLWAQDEDCYTVGDQADKLIGKLIECHGLSNDFCKNMTIDRITECKKQP